MLSGAAQNGQGAACKGG